MVPQRSSSRSKKRRLAILPVLLFVAGSAFAQTGPQIQHDGLRCVLAGEHLKLQAYIQPVEGLTTVKAYFRANLYTQFYYVEMVRNGDFYEGLLPKPSTEIDGIHYYLEAVDSSFNSARTAEFTPQVVGERAVCKEENPVPPVYATPAGNIVVGSTAGPLLPPGFAPQSLIALPRVLAGGSGGLSAGVIGGIAAAGGAAAVVGVLTTGGDAGTPATSTVPVVTTTVPGPTTTIGAGTTTVPSGMTMACFETTPSPPRITVGGSVRFEATCSEPRDGIANYQWNLSDGRTDRVGRVVNKRYTDAGTFPATLTVTALDGSMDSTEMNVIVDPGATTTTGGGPGPPGSVINFSKSGPATGTVGVQFNYTINLTNAGATDATGISMTDNVPAGLTVDNVTFNANVDNCSGGPSVTCTRATLAAGATFSVTIQVTPASSGMYNNTATFTSASPSEGGASGVNTAVPLRAPDGSPGRITSRLTSALELPPGDGTTQARVTFNENRTAIVDNAGPSSLEVAGRRGQNLVDGLLMRTPVSEGLWRFNFVGAPGFTPGSFVVELGDVVSRQPHEIVFRVAPGARRVRFRFGLTDR